MESSTIIIIFMVVIGAVLVTAVIIGLVFALKRRTVARVLSVNKQWIKKTFWGTVPSTFNVNGRKYQFDHRAIIRGFWGDQIYYLHDRKDPLRFEINKKRTDLDIHPQAFKDIVDNNVISQLLGGDNLTKLLMILAVVNVMVGLGIAGVLLFGGGETTCSLQATNQTLSVIKAGVQSAFN